MVIGWFSPYFEMSVFTFYFKLTNYILESCGNFGAWQIEDM